MNQRPRKRIMHRFRIDEISSVDRPAQEAALAAIIKSGRHDTFFKGPPFSPPLPTIVTFEGAVEEIAKRDKCRVFDALQKAAREHPDLLAKYRAAPIPASSGPVAKAQSVRDFEKAVRRYRFQREVLSFGRDDKSSR